MDFYSFAKTIVKSLLVPLYRIETIGTENIPKEGGVLICANHTHNLDPPVVGITMNRPVVFMAKEELFRIPILKGILKKLHAFPVRRGKVDREAIRKGLSVLKEGKVLGLFPEGTRNKSGEIGKALSGAGFFALRTDAYVIPCAIIGTYKPLKKLKVVYGKPIDLEPFRKGKSSAEEVTNIIMNQIKMLMKHYQ